MEMSMNIRAYVELEIEKNGKVYRFMIPNGSPFVEAHEVTLEFSQAVLDLEKKSLEVQQPTQEEQQPSES
jgi:hypothetical protein